MTRLGALALFALLLCVSIGCRPNSNVVRVFSAASAKPAIESLWPGGPDGRLSVHTASSSTLARQIESGARCDLFVSAHPDWLEALFDQGLIAKSEIAVLATNSLVLAERRDRPFDPSGSFRVATGDPEHVPLGIYAEQALQNSERFDWLDKILPAADASAAAELLRRGEVDAAILYKTDVLQRDELVIVEEIDRNTHDPIELRIAILRGARSSAREWFDHLTRPEGRAALEELGYGVSKSSQGGRPVEVKPNGN